MSTDPKVEQLLKEGMAAARAGDKTLARARLREVVTLDQYNEKGWYWLASVAETDEERRIALGNVVVINPQNERAQQLLEQLTTPPSARPASGGRTADGDAPLPNSMRRTAMIVGGVVFVMLVLVILLFRGGGGNDPIPTQAVIAAQESPTIDVTLTTVAETAAAAIGATQTSLATRRVLPPTWTPSPQPTARGTLVGTAMARPAVTLPGRIVVTQGKPLTLDGFLPYFLLDPNTGETTPLFPGERGDFGLISPNGQRLIYSRLVTGARAQLLLRAANLGGTQPEEISSRWSNNPPLSNQQMVSLSANGQALVFVANNITGENDATSDIYYLPVNFPLTIETATPTPTETPTPPPTAEGTTEVTPTETPTATAGSAGTPEPTVFVSPVRRLTARDSGVNTWPSVSPDGQQVVYVSDQADLNGQGPDLYLISVEGGTPQNLTNDSGANIEAAPAWSPDGSLIVFQSRPEGSEESDLYLMNADGSNKRPLITTPGDDIRPHWSPDGQFIAFSSTRNGKWEIYVVEVATGTVYQLTTTPDVIIATDWGP